MLEKSLEIALQMKKQSELDAKTLPLEQKIQIAEDCMKKTKNFHEYKEIEQILKDLQKEHQDEMRMERHGFINRNTQMDPEKASQVVAVVNKEFKQAEKEYINLQKKAEAVKNKYLVEMNSLLKSMETIQSNYRFINENIKPSPYEFENVAIPIPWSVSNVNLLLNLNRVLSQREV